MHWPTNPSSSSSTALRYTTHVNVAEERDYNRSIYCCVSIATKSREDKVCLLSVRTDRIASRTMELLCASNEFSPGMTRIWSNIAHNRVHRYLDSAPLVADKLLSIAALLAIYLLPDGTNPLRRVLAYLRGQPVNPDSEDFETITFRSLPSEEYLLLLTFSQRLVEQIPNAKQSQQDKYEAI
jgi:hypothetical protein